MTKTASAGCFSVAFFQKSTAQNKVFGKNATFQKEKLNFSTIKKSALYADFLVAYYPVNSNF